MAHPLEWNSLARESHTSGLEKPDADVLKSEKASGELWFKMGFITAGFQVILSLAFLISLLFYCLLLMVLYIFIGF